MLYVSGQPATINRPAHALWVQYLAILVPYFSDYKSLQGISRINQKCVMKVKKMYH